MPFSINGEEWGNFLCEIFDEWIKRDTRKVSVRLFDSILTLMVDGTYNVCRMGRNCCQYFVVEHNGDIYPCDFFVDSDKKLGNIMNDSWEKLQTSPKYIEFGKKKALWNNECDRCEYLKYCFGDCLKGKIFVFPHGKGSTVGSYVLYRMKKLGTSPAAIINRRTDAIIATSFSFSPLNLSSRPISLKDLFMNSLTSVVTPVAIT